MNTTLKRISLLSLLAMALPAQAHKLWLLPSHTSVSEPQWVTVDASISNDIFAVERAYPLDYLQVTGPDGQAATVENLLKGHRRSVFDVNLDKPGSYRIAVANHAMLSLPHGARLSFSPKRWWETPATGLETDPARGRGLFAYPAMSEDPRSFPLADGSTGDLTRYPVGRRHEDFAVGVEAAGRTLGWTAVARSREADLFLSLRNATRLPMTMLWFSNGGRDYAPWNGRHVNVLGVEEGLNRSLLGHSAQQVPNALDAAGVPSALPLHAGTSTETRHVIGSLPWEGDGEIAGIEAADGGLTLRTSDGTARHVPCDLAFLEL